MTPDQLLDAGADLIEEHGLAKGKFGSLDSGFCFYGSLWRVIKDRAGFVPTRVINEAARAVSQELDDRCPAQTLASQWNDLPGTTQTEVVDTMRFAAKRLRNA